MDTRPYTEFINVADGNDWVGFHKTFWGQESALAKVHETAFLDVSDERLKDASGLFFHFTDRIYVRKDYQELYTYLCDEFDKGSLGVIVSGSPGIGAYSILQNMSTIYHSATIRKIVFQFVCFGPAFSAKENHNTSNRPRVLLYL